MGAGNLLSDGRHMKAMEGSFTQREMFTLFRKFNSQVEGIAKVKDVDDALNTSKIYVAVMGYGWVRTDEYGFYPRDPKAPLGKELLWIENGTVYKKIIPDIPVQFEGKEISLQKVVGMGIYPSISLLQINQTGEKEFMVSPVSLDAIAGKVRAMNFMRDGWAEPDEHGFPDGNKPSSSSSDTARYGSVRTNFDKEATGYHGSFGRYVSGCDGGRGVGAYDGWSGGSGVASVGREAAAPLEMDTSVSSTAGLQLIRNSTELVVKGTPEQLDAAMRLLQSLKQ